MVTQLLAQTLVATASFKLAAMLADQRSANDFNLNSHQSFLVSKLDGHIAKEEEERKDREG